MSEQMALKLNNGVVMPMADIGTFLQTLLHQYPGDAAKVRGNGSSGRRAKVKMTKPAVT